MEAAPIPWTHGKTDIGSVWQWSTPHFHAVITGDSTRLYWRIVDKTTGKERPLLDGYANSFTQAEDQIREVVGKSYPPAAGYRPYAGSLATTFTLGDGTEFDFGPWTGRILALNVITDPNPHSTKSPETTTIRGPVHVINYTVAVDITEPDGTEVTYSIIPTYITTIATETGKPLTSKRDTSTPTKRITKGRYQPGCTGTPGYLGDTVDHTSKRPCPIHEV